MRYSAACCVAFIAAGTTFGQTVAGPDEGVDVPPAVAALRPRAVGHQHLVGVQLQAGLPLGARVQVGLFGTGGRSLLVEFFGGIHAELFETPRPVFGIGTRGLFTLFDDGGRNAVLFGPGIGVSYWAGKRETIPKTPTYGFYSIDFNPDPPRPGSPVPTLLYLNADATLSYLHDFTPRLGWEIGIQVGARLGLSGQSWGEPPIAGMVRPTFGVFTGFRY